MTAGEHHYLDILDKNKILLYSHTDSFPNLSIHKSLLLQHTYIMEFIATTTLTALCIYVLCQHTKEPQKLFNIYFSVYLHAGKKVLDDTEK